VIAWLHVTRTESEARFNEMMCTAAKRSAAEAEAEAEAPTVGAEVTQVLHDLSRLDHLVRLHRIFKGAWPETLADLASRKPLFPDAAGFPVVPTTDPWGRPYVIVRRDGEGQIDLVSLGSDGSTGGDGSARDLSLEALAKERGYSHFTIPMSELSMWGSSGAFGESFFFEGDVHVIVAEGRLGAALAEFVRQSDDPRDESREGFSFAHGALAGAIITGGGDVQIRFAKRVE
jgi:hypothetical protein